MIIFMEKQRTSLPSRILSSCIALTFLFSMIIPPGTASAQMLRTVLNLPVPGTMVPMSAPFVPCMIQGITAHPDNPLKFNFILDSGNERIESDSVKKESQKLIKYFLATLTIPEDELWVNLSPYEKDRVIAVGFSIISGKRIGKEILGPGL